MPLARCVPALAVSFMVLPGCVMPQLGRPPEVGGTTPEPDEVARRLDELIRRTNEIESYVAEYEVTGPEGWFPGTDGVIRLAFGGRDRAKLEILGQEGWARVCYVGPRVGVADGTDPEGSPRWHCFDLDSMVEHFEAVDEALKGLGAEVPGFSSQWRLHMDPPSDPEDQISCHVVMASEDSPVLPWLAALPRTRPHWSREGNDLTFSYKGLSISVSEETGFVTDMAWRETTLRLRDLVLDGPVDAEFELPAPVSGLGGQKYRRIGRSLAAEFFQARRKAVVELELDDHGEETLRIRAAWRDLYAGLCDLEFGEWVTTQRDFARSMRAWIEDSARIHREVWDYQQQQNQELEEYLEQGRELLRSWMDPNRYLPTEFVADEDLQEQERLIADAVFESRVAAPIQEAYREAFASWERR